jgi:nucleoside-diphosphate-sugar epimerase
VAEKTVLVTGGSGFLGSWCVIELLRRGHRVRTTVRDLGREAEVRAAIAPEVDPGESLTFFAADLLRDEGWDQAVEGCDHVLHVASPFPPAQPKDPDELIVPARDGTLRVLRAALEGGVERIVITSSVAAVAGSGKPISEKRTEDDWTDLANDELSPYVRSKTVAERAAWDLARDEGAEDRVAVVNPGAILGPVLSEDRSFSLQVIERLLKGMPGIPRIGFSFVDVRDVADLEIRAMESPAAGGHRYIATDEFMWMAEVAEALREELGSDAARVPSRSVPNLVVKAMALFDPGVRGIVGQLGRKVQYSSERARSELGWSPRSSRESAVDTARSMISAS